MVKVHWEVVADHPESDSQGLHREVRREEGIAKSWPDGQEVTMADGVTANNKAYQADKLAKGSKVQKATVTLMRRLDG